MDFARLLSKTQQVQPTDPIELYNSLDRKSQASGDLRDSQKTVLTEWYHNHFDDKDIIVKLHTGEGKTLVGMLMLLSRMYNDKGPCLYVCPNRQLANQAASEAVKFGIPYTLLQDGDLPMDFAESKKIVITHVQKVFNGKTVFGLDKNGQYVGTFVLDDSHACIDSIKTAISIIIKREDPLYQKFLKLFESELKKQGAGDYLELLRNEYSTVIKAVPYWDWLEKKDDVLGILMDASEQDNIKFSLPLVQNLLQYCTAYFTGRGMEIVPFCSLIERFTSFHKAGQRILMSATTQDDSFFIRGLGLAREAIMSPLTNTTATWSGEKMIIFPSIIDERLTTDYIRSVTQKISQALQTNVAVLVPNFYISREYSERQCVVITASNIDEQIASLKDNSTPHSVVFVNRYDGIDLPDNMCRILIMDSLPICPSLSDRYEQYCREGSEITNTKSAQKIEQGLGRSVRSIKDYSVILIVGTDIVRFMKSSSTQKLFSSQTIQQIKIGEFVSEQVSEEKNESRPFLPIKNLIEQCLKRDSGWKQYYSQQMGETISNHQMHPFIDIIEMEREADIALLNNELARVCEIYGKIVSKIDSKSLDYGWYLQEKARYTYLIDKVESIRIQQEAFRHNNYLLMPDNNTYKKMHIQNDNRLKSVLQYLNKYDNYQEFKLRIDEILANCSFGVSADKFEQAIMEVGMLLGFESDRPDKTIKKGPDNIWGMNANSYMAIECKNEVNLNRETINKEEVGQMENHCGWFESEYGKNVDVVYAIIHPTNKVSPTANFTHTVRVITPNKLNELTNQINAFVKELAKYDIHNIKESTINEMLNINKLDYNSLRKKYSVEVQK